MNTPTYLVTGIRNDTKNTVNFPVYTKTPPILGSNYYARHIDAGVFIVKVIKV